MFPGEGFLSLAIFIIVADSEKFGQLLVICKSWTLAFTFLLIHYSILNFLFLLLLLFSFPVSPYFPHFFIVTVGRIWPFSLPWASFGVHEHICLHTPYPNVKPYQLILFTSIWPWFKVISGPEIRCWVLVARWSNGCIWEVQAVFFRATTRLMPKIPSSTVPKKVFMRNYFGQWCRVTWTWLMNSTLLKVKIILRFHVCTLRCISWPISSISSERSFWASD